MTVSYQIKEKTKKKVNLKKYMNIALIFIISVSILLEVFSAHIVMKFSHPKASKVNLNFKEYGLNNYEEINFNSAKGDTKLKGYLIKKDNSKKTIIICHGYGDNKFMDGGKSSSVNVDHLKLSKVFLQQGYNTVIFDFRGHGENIGKNAVTIGFNEQQDLLGAISFVKSKGIGEKIGLIGFSMGAATSLSVLDKTKDVSFAIADSPFSDLKDYLKSNMAHWTGLPNFPFAAMAIMNFKLIYGVNYKTVSPMNSIAKTDIPILIVHGKKDPTIPYTESVRMEKEFKNKKSELILFDNSIHIGSYSLYGKKYENTLIKFLTSI